MSQVYLLLEDDKTRELDVIESYTGNSIYTSNPWMIVRNFREFTGIIELNGIPKVISFDHDLGKKHYLNQGREIYYEDFDEPTGWHCAKWLIDYCLDKKLPLPEQIYIHSMNTVGATNIKSLFTTLYKVYPELDNGHRINDVLLVDDFYFYKYY